MIDFSPVRDKKKTLAELAEGLTVTHLHRLTDEMVDTQLHLIEETVDDDVVFVPVDPQAEDPYADDQANFNLAWTLGHVIVHITASGEEAAAQASELARGIRVQGRSRYEIPWETIHTAAQLRSRLEESRRMRHAFLNAWPDEPHLETTYTPDYPGAKPRNAIIRFLSGLGHDDAHLDQIKEIMRQSQAARSVP
jgi:tRNA U34 5-methylaminomethyl-2-thiouridine-forming methyltransferase MnmC